MPGQPIRSTDLASARMRNAIACFAIAAAIIAAGIAWLGFEETFDVNARDFMPLPAGFAGAFALFGLIHLAQGGLDIARRRKFGQSTLDAGHAALGANFAGRIRTDSVSSVTGPYKILLRCVRHWTDDDIDDGPRGRSEHLWESSQSVSPSRAGAGIPFSFSIPAKGLPSRSAQSAGGDTIVWTLSVTAPAGVMNYAADFQIDVGGKRVAAAGNALAEFRKIARPEQPGWRLFRHILTVAGPLILALGLFALGNQAWHSYGGTAFTGRIAAIGRPFSDVALDTGGAPVKVRGLTKHQAWAVGQPVVVTCRMEEGERAGCRMDTGLDRWLDASGTALAGLLLALAALWLWRRRAAR